MYTTTLFLHSWLRWIILLLGLLALWRSFQGYRQNSEWSAQDNKLNFFFVLFYDLQVTIGLLLYFVLSPITLSGMQDFKNAVQVPSIRFFLMDHTTTMLLSVVVLHVGRVIGRKAPTGAIRHKRNFVMLLILMLLLATAIPWPNFEYGRPLFRF